MNLGQYFQIGHWLDKYGWTNYRGLDNYLKNPYHWTISQDILSNNKERNKDCPMNMDRRHFSSRTNTREMDNFSIHFLNRIWENVYHLPDTLLNMHGTHKNSLYGWTITFFWDTLWFRTQYSGLFLVRLGTCLSRWALR